MGWMTVLVKEKLLVFNLIAALHASFGHISVSTKSLQINSNLHLPFLSMTIYDILGANGL